MSSQNEPLNIYELATRVQFLEEKIIDGIDNIKENQQSMKEELTKISEALYEPDQGLYSRLKVVENTRNSDSKIIWLIFSAFGGGFLTYVANLLLK
jgi:hypothetical protein